MIVDDSNVGRVGNGECSRGMVAGFHTTYTLKVAINRLAICMVLDLCTIPPLESQWHQKGCSWMANADHSLLSCRVSWFLRRPSRADHGSLPASPLWLAALNAPRMMNTVSLYWVPPLWFVSLCQKFNYILTR